MPQDLPGFYYDAARNRYFPMQSPIPGSSSRNTSSASTSAQKEPPKSKQANDGEGAKVVRMVHDRELCGNSISCNKKKVNFQDEYEKKRISKPTIWKYEWTERMAETALEHVYVNIQTPQGLKESQVLLTGRLDSTFCTYEVGPFGERADYATQFLPDLVNLEKKTESLKPPGLLWRAISANVTMTSNVSSIKIHHSQPTDNNSSPSYALITTLGHETSGGSVYLMDLSEPLDYVLEIDVLGRRINWIYSMSNSTIWTADCSSDGNRAVVGTNSGAALVNIESGRRTWILRSKSDVLSSQFDSSGNIVLCGLRNGAILTVDTRQKPQDLQNRLPKHQINFPSLKTSEISSKKREKQWFEVKGNIHHSRMMYMPSSVSCLVGLKLYDQYFLASSMDGTVRLYDHRLTKKGAVQFYEGNVNSHTRTQMGVDPSERFFMSGGEDLCLRAWSIKSGEMLYEDNFMDSVASVVCWERRGGHDFPGPGVWLGSREGIYYVNT